MTVQDGSTIAADLKLSTRKQELLIRTSSQPHDEGVAPAQGESAKQGSGGEHLSSGAVSSLPLNARDFSKLLLLAAGTMTDSNGAANFTQQFAVNGQRGTPTVFAMDGFDTTDPEMGGATFSNFNVDAIQEVQASSGVMPAEIGHGAAGFTEIITRSGTNGLHGSVFEYEGTHPRPIAGVGGRIGSAHGSELANGLGRAVRFGQEPLERGGIQQGVVRRSWHEWSAQGGSRLGRALRAI